MVEDSMKNVRKAKELGLKTILIAGKGRKRNSASGTAGTSASQVDDGPDEDDPAVDVCLEEVDEMRAVLPGLWDTSPTFSRST